MLPASADRAFLTGCAVLILAGLAVCAVGYWLSPTRVARHWWRNR